MDQQLATQGVADGLGNCPSEPGIVQRQQQRRRQRGGGIRGVSTTTLEKRIQFVYSILNLN